MTRSFSTSTGKTFIKKDWETRKILAQKALINGIYQSIEKHLLSLNPATTKSLIKLFVEAHIEKFLNTASTTERKISIKNKIYEVGRFWLMHHGLEIPEDWKPIKTTGLIKGPRPKTPSAIKKSKTKPLNKKQIRKLHREVDANLNTLRKEKGIKKIWITTVQGGSPGLGRKKS